MTLKEELESIQTQEKVLESRKAEIYRLSITALPEEKVVDNFVAEMMVNALTESEFSKDIQYPIVVHGITEDNHPVIQKWRHSIGSYVSIRPCAEECKGKTYLGIYLGDIALGMSVSYHEKTGVMTAGPRFHNPAIWVPDLNRIVFGAESWWGVLKDPKDLHQITDADINSIWYVQAAKQVGIVPVPLDKAE